MEELITKNTKCPNCNHNIEYWTKSNYIECPDCKELIKVEPCELVKKITLDDLLENEIVFAKEGSYGDDEEDYWVEYYEDENFIKEIEDIDEFVRNYNEVADE